jgi:hypothetical protein
VIKRRLNPKVLTRIEQIVRQYFVAYNRTVSDDEMDYVMDFLKVLLIKQGRYK